MPSDATEHSPQQQALHEAMSALLQPLARLAVAQGLPAATLENLLRRSIVQAAREVQPDPTAQRVASRISTATGITRREVTRLLENEDRARTPPRSVASEVFAHWTTARGYRDSRGQPRVLPRQGPGVSFETLAQTVTRHVHPRSVLDELVRLGLATHDAEQDTVTLQRHAFVPRGDMIRMLGFLGDNVGDHLSAAVQNVLSEGPRHFEQAVFADELSRESLAQIRTVIRAQWKALIEATVPLLEKMIEDDQTAQRVRDQRLRIGMYTFNDTLDGQAPSAQPPDQGTKRARSKRKEST
jgi:hypothetical protein